MYDLPLEPVFGSFRSIDCESNGEIKDRIEAIQSFEGKLKFYNNYVRSLSAYSMDARIYLEWDRPDNCLKIYCGCATCRKQTDFDPKKEQTFLELRAKEVERLRKAVDKQKGYQEKLNAVFETKGFHPYNTPPIIHPNVPYDGTTNIDLDLHHTKPVIDLWPGTKEERIIYNDFVRAAFDRKYRTASGFSLTYKSFDFEKEKRRFEKAAGEAKVQDGRLREYLISKIEKHFDYPACIEAQDKETDIQKSIRKNLEECGIVKYLFCKLVCGVPVDLDENVLNETALMHYVHFFELVKFYAYLKQCADNMKGQTLIETLSLNSILAKNDLSFYTNKENIPNQELVKQTIDYFTEGKGKRAFQALTFLNLLWPQKEFLLRNLENREKVVSHLQSLPLTELEEHIFFGFIIKWFGGYPVNNLNEDCQKILKHIQQLFLAYPGQTPEKEFCRADDATRRKFAKLGIALTTAINHNLDAKQVYDALEEAEPQEKTYGSFNELFEDAARNGSLGEFNGQQAYLMKRSRYKFQFDEWLLETKGWEFNNDETYTGFLKKENWLEFLKHEQQKEMERQARIEREEQNWQVQPQKTEDFKKGEEITEVAGIDDLVKICEDAGEVVRPTRIEFFNDGTHKVKEWAIGKTIDELYKEKVEQIKKEVEGLEAKCFSESTDNAGLNLLAQQLKEVIYLYRHRNNVFENNPEQQKNIEENFKAAANRLESLLNDVVLPKIAFRNSKAIKPNEAGLPFTEKKGALLTFQTEAAKNLVAILNPFFNEAHQTALEKLLLQRTDVNELLLFRDNGNRLANAFKQLWEHSLITGCQKQDLETFILSRFQYLYRNETKRFTPDYAEKCISRNDNPCKNPLVKIEAGKVVKVETPKRRKRNNN